jgi:hypothetical protein
LFGPTRDKQQLGSLNADATLEYEHARYMASAQYKRLVENLHADGR